MTARFGVLGFGFLIGFSAAPVLSHHAATEFDTDTVLRYDGVVREYVWANPHIRAVLETQSETGSPITLEIEGNSPTTLRSIGVSASSLASGERVTALVSPSRRFPESSAIGIQFIKEDGTSVPFTTNRARLAEHGIKLLASTIIEQSAATIFETWVANGGPGPLMRESREWPLTEHGRRRFDEYLPMMSPHAECVPTSAPWLMAYSAAAVFEQLDDRIVFRSDWLGAERTIYMDGRDHPAAEITFPQGHSVGRWEDETLVVETANFTDIIYNAIPNSGQKQLVERFSVSDDGKRLNYSFVMQDPEYLVGDVSGAISFDYRPDLELENLECDSEIARRFFREFE